MDKPIEDHYEKYQAKVRLSYESAMEEIAGCEGDLQEVGIQAVSLVFPHSAYADWSVDLVSRCYFAARDGHIKEIMDLTICLLANSTDILPIALTLRLGSSQGMKL